KGEIGGLKENRLRHDPRYDRQRIDAGIEDSKSTGLPHPSLARMPVAHILLPLDVERANDGTRKPFLRLDNRSVVLRVPGRKHHLFSPLRVSREVEKFR